MKQDVNHKDHLDVAATAVSESVYARRMLDPRPQRRHVRLAARALCHGLVLALQAGTALARLFRGRRVARRRTRVGGARMALTGTFLADSWIEAHVRPLALASRCDHVWVVADRPFVPLRRVSYVCPPRWLQKLCGRVAARSLVFLWWCVVHRPEVVGGFHLLFNGLLAQCTARLIGARAMYFCVGGWAEFLNGAVHGGNRLFTRIGQPDVHLERRLLRSIAGFDLILTMGTKARAFMRERGIRAVPIEVMSGGIDGRRYDGLAESKQYDVITVCRVEKVKRLDVLLDTVAQVARRIPGVKVAIVGDGGELPALQARAAALKLQDNVDFVGRHSDVERWLARARLFVLTSDSEGLSLALMEAVTAGLPAVVSDVGDLGDVVVDGVNGYRPPPRRPELFARYICELLENDEHYRRFAAAAREAARAYDVETMQARWDAILARWGVQPATTGSDRLPQLAAHGRPSRKQLWEQARAWTGRPAAQVLAAVPPRLWLGRRFRRELCFLEQARRWDAEQLAEYQLQQVQNVVRLAWERSPYYRRALQDCGYQPRDLQDLQDLQALPTIDRHTIGTSAEDLLTVGPQAGGVDFITTSGTAGRPLRLCIDRGRSPREYAHLVASWQRTGYRLGDALAVFRGRQVGRRRDGLYHELDPQLRHHCYSSFHLGNEDIARYMQHIRTIGPCHLHVYPSVVAVLARWLQRHRQQPPENIRGIIAESEIVYPEQRAWIEEVFGCRYFACYGQSEKVVLAAECEHAAHYHVWPTYGYFELLDEDGRCVRTPGGRGEIVGTGFFNTVMPFIRYRTGDYATFVADGCDACGRRHPVIRDIGGHRVQEMVVLADGSHVPWAALNVHDHTFRHVQRFQLLQELPGQAVLRIVPESGFGDDDRRRILKSLCQRLDARLDITLQVVDDIPACARGKAIYVEQRIAESLNSAARCR